MYDTWVLGGVCVCVARGMVVGYWLCSLTSVVGNFVRLVTLSGRWLVVVFKRTRKLRDQPNRRKRGASKHLVDDILVSSDSATERPSDRRTDGPKERTRELLSQFQAVGTVESSKDLKVHPTQQQQNRMKRQSKR